MQVLGVTDYFSTNYRECSGDALIGCPAFSVDGSRGARLCALTASSSFGNILCIYETVPWVLGEFAAGTVEVFPAIAFFDDGFQILLPNHGILHGIFDDGALHPSCEIVGVEAAIAKVSS